MLQLSWLSRTLSNVSWRLSLDSPPRPSQGATISSSLSLFPSSCFSSSSSSFSFSPFLLPLGHRTHRHSCAPLRATTPRADGYARRVRSSSGTIRAVRRYSRGGIASPMGNPTARIWSGGGGNRPDAICLSPTRFRSWNATEIQILVSFICKMNNLWFIMLELWMGELIIKVKWC